MISWRYAQDASNQSPLNPVYLHSLYAVSNFLAVKTQDQATPAGAASTETAPPDSPAKFDHNMFDARRKQIRSVLDALQPRHPLLAAEQITTGMKDLAAQVAKIENLTDTENPELKKYNKQVADLRSLIVCFLEVDDPRLFRMGIEWLRNTSTKYKDGYEKGFPDTIEVHYRATAYFREVLNSRELTGYEEEKALRCGQELIRKGKQTPAACFYLGMIYKQRGLAPANLKAEDDLAQAVDFLTLAAASGGQFNQLTEAADACIQLAARLKERSETDKTLTDMLTQRAKKFLNKAYRADPGNDRVVSLRKDLEDKLLGK
jgi:hypothetical protein